MLLRFDDIVQRSIDGYDVHEKRYILMLRHIGMYIITVGYSR